ncbi:DoxX family protein [Pelagicoccus sp. SDUM812003]|uniref:DoxX family protein n=1 Tax=Pelagicoccus sp. SDUM812003 TaxID=3041267 RepID=UPI00280DC398|nr:DoxX family protein [Pelagicoccus sp. SDUM812003]MDQ8203406.1 DoxX family protein [Pelagicoccus sp. SDUM812003]
MNTATTTPSSSQSSSLSESASGISPLARLFATTDSYAPLIARLTLAIVIFPHGAQKALGWFGGYGFSGTMGFFTENMGIPALFAFLAIVAEFLGPIALLFGALSRVAAFGVGTTIAVAMFFGHTANGFFMNWYGNQAGEGIEYHLLVIGLALIGVISGGGKLSADRVIANKLK